LKWLSPKEVTAVTVSTGRRPKVELLDVVRGWPEVVDGAREEGREEGLRQG
jgi:hypothetical protein